MKILSEVQSICPQCERPVSAQYVEREGAVYLEKTCPEHGLFRALIARQMEDYKEWIKNPVVNIPPKTAMTEGAPGDDECPLHCGTCSNHRQTACCVLIDITNRCNQHCPYCFARADEDTPDPQEPTLAQLEAKFDLLLELGEERPFNIQISGGEPTVREDLPQIIEMAQRKGFEYVQINSNGRRLGLEEGYARKLKRAGASVIFMQFDGTGDEIYRALRGEPLLEIKKKAIENCRKAGLPVTLVPTIVKNVNLDHIGEMLRFLMDHIDVVKGIHFQPVSFFGRCPEHLDTRQGADAVHEDFENRVTMFDVLREIEKQCPVFRREEFAPIATGHTLCCFYSTYLKEEDGSVRCLVSQTQREEGISCCDAASPSSCCCEPDPLEIIKKDRDYVLNKWDLPEEPEDACDCCCQESAQEPAESCCTSGGAAEACCSEPDGTAAESSCCGEAETVQETSCCCETTEETPMDMDEFLNYYKRNTFTVTGMAFQDATNLDAERLKRCRVQVLTEDNRLVPFCGYNSIYRGEEK